MKFEFLVENGLAKNYTLAISSSQNWDAPGVAQN